MEQLDIGYIRTGRKSSSKRRFACQFGARVLFFCHAKSSSSSPPSTLTLRLSSADNLGPVLVKMTTSGRQRMLFAESALAGTQTTTEIQ